MKGGILIREIGEIRNELEILYQNESNYHYEKRCEKIPKKKKSHKREKTEINPKKQQID
jgi:hypothetical protein